MNDPVEIKLVGELRACRRCASLWTADDRYGPFPQCSSDALAKLPTSPATPTATPITGFDLPAPAALKGCRKAPLMIIGINPNLTGFWTLPDNPKYSLKGPLAVYPRFESDSAYALAYRYIVPDHHEYLMQPDDLAGLVDRGRKHYLADSDGALVPVNKTQPDASPSIRNKHDRALILGLQPTGKPMRRLPITWATDENYVTVANSVRMGELIAGAMTHASTVGKTVRLRADRGSSYYDRAQQICERLGLVIGEDVSMHDMVACATPGWSATKHGINQSELKKNCLQDASFTLRQLRQSRPVLMIFSGSDAFKMLLESLPSEARVVSGNSTVKAGEILREIDADIRKSGVSRSFEISLAAGNEEPDWNSTAVVIPHLSYGERPRSFDQGVPRKGWGKFEVQFPASFALITQAPENAGRSGALRVSPDTWDKLNTVEEPGALTQLLAIGGGDPRVNALAHLVAQFRGAGRLPELPSGSRAKLARSQGSCKFCSAFNIPEGCPYDINKSEKLSMME